MPEQSQNLWAPWRIDYIRSSGGPGNPDACFLCQYAAAPDLDGEHGVIWRTPSCLTLFNAFPYSNGHLMVAPVQHAPKLDALSDEVMLEIMQQTRDAQRLLAELVGAHGFNVGLNFGRCAGAGLPGHLHMHIVPRWDGDTNFMSVIGDTRVVPESIQAIQARMREAAPRLGLPPVR